MTRRHWQTQVREKRLEHTTGSAIPLLKNGPKRRKGRGVGGGVDPVYERGVWVKCPGAGMHKGRICSWHFLIWTLKSNLNSKLTWILASMMHSYCFFGHHEWAIQWGKDRQSGPKTKMSWTGHLADQSPPTSHLQEAWEPPPTCRTSWCRDWKSHIPYVGSLES